MTCGIYRIYNKMSGKSYIGQSKNVEKRIYGHFHNLNNSNHHNNHLQSAFLLYGAENFEHQLIESCEEEALTQREEYWIDAALYYAGVYNLARPEDGKALTVEICRKMSDAKKGKPLTEEHRRKMSESQKERLRRKRNEKSIVDCSVA